MRDESWVFGDRRKRRPARRGPDPEDAGDWIVVEYAPIKCPCCGGDTRQNGQASAEGVRYHRCLREDCGLPFKSLERPVRVVFCPGPMRHLLHSGNQR